jgi:1,4-alpha-glucan branching enzyme
MVEKGYLALVLHAHLPYVRHPESENYIEERWLFEAITETYLPLLHVFDGLQKDGVPFRMTLSLTPTLLSMLTDPFLQKRYSDHLHKLIQLAKKEVRRNKKDPDTLSLSEMYYENFLALKETFETTYEKNIVLGFRKYQDLGYLELITCSATHAFLPYVKTEQAIRAQIENAVKVHEQHLGRSPKGIWLPECGYQHGIDSILRDYGIEYFFTETHGVLHANPKPSYDVYAPVVTGEGIAAFARDVESSKQVWSSKEGYPGDHDYREYYRDIGFDLDYDYLKPYLHKTGIRLNTGIKYFRITGETTQKELYNPEWAKGKAATHAGHFMYNREKQVEHLSRFMDRKPIVVASYDAELFGHWWYEGPLWLDQLCRKIHSEQQTIKMATPLDYLQEYPENEVANLSMSSWGRGGYGDVWLGQSNEWIYRHLHKMEERMIELADRYPLPTALEERALNQAVRELLLAQSSDWAFIMDSNTMVDYATKRAKNHIGRFNRIYHDLLAGTIDLAWLEQVELRDALFPAVQYQTYATKLGNVAEVQWLSTMKPKVLMLSWEYPPMMVGGLSRHVYDLSRHLVKHGIEVHVVTSHIHGYPDYELNQGVHVHRVKVNQEKDVDFMGWVFQLNLAMMDYTKALIRKYVHFDIIHAHDWLVGYAARSLKQQFQIPLVGTIHATEHGRNHGIHTDLQRKIHQLEYDLTYESARVICCSHYMNHEIQEIFALPADKIDIIPNGVDSELVRVHSVNEGLRRQFALPHEKIVFFVGRMVREKGVHLLLESVPGILSHCPEAKFVLGGKGPMLEELKRKAWEMGIQEKVLFTGFVDDDTRNQLLHFASATVFPSLYEPFGIVALEAMAAKTPVVVSDVGGLSEIIEHEVDGLKVIPGDVYSLVTQISTLLNDQGLAEKLRKNASTKIVELYQWDQIARLTLNAYINVDPSKQSIMESFLQTAGANVQN